MRRRRAGRVRATIRHYYSTRQDRAGPIAGRGPPSGWVRDLLPARRDRGRGADGPENLGNRDAQRNLSEEGRAQAEAIGEAFRKLDVPVGEVLSSPYYRSLDTARIAFDRAEPTSELLGIRSDRSFQREQRETALLNLLSTPPRDGTNTILVSHALNAEEFAGITLDEGEAAVLEPLGGDFRFIVRVAPEEWNQLSGSARDAPGEVGARG
jgi:phosphohistidine phosphatase SixA